ncbi:SDR family oxidoreductase [Falsiroseomonas sp. HC035]|uniref:SDR family oxidoreductase n=1 Tax=Falsiroseomonas sp. HC035 TaxID=3390999 RepID=UPI003D31AEF4
MAPRLKPLSQQVLVITGASSGIGLATARMAAQRGAAVVLVARSEASLAEAVAEIREAGGRAEYRVADVADREALQGAADLATEKFGGFDAWVNDAGGSIYGTQEQTPVEDQRRLFETNYWGTVHGSLIACAHLKPKGGALVNVGSVLSDRAMIYQGTYSATKHAVKAFTDALRMELEAERAPVSVTLIKPASIETTFQDHARILLDTPGVMVPPPTYDPRLVARAILFACTTPRRDLYVGGGGAAISLFGNLFPRGTDLVMQAIGRSSQTTRRTGKPERRDNLYQGRPGGAERSSLSGTPQRTSSLLLEAQMNPVAALAATAGLAALVAGTLMTGAMLSRRR